MSVEFAPLLIEPAYRKVAAAIGERILSRVLRETCVRHASLATRNLRSISFAIEGLPGA